MNQQTSYSDAHIYLQVSISCIYDLRLLIDMLMPVKFILNMFDSNCTSTISIMQSGHNIS